MKKLLPFFALLISFSSYGQTINIEPLELVTKVFTNRNFVPEIPQYITGRYDGVPNVNTYNHAYQLSFRLLKQNSTTAIVNITLDSMRQGKDIYAHLQKEEVWKIEEIRSLPINYSLQENWKYIQAEKAQTDSLKIADSSYQPPAEGERRLDSNNIWFTLDDQIIDHFKNHEIEFERMLREIKNKEKENANQISLGEYVSTDYKNLEISRISVSDYGEGCYDFLLSEYIYSSLGYLYIPDPKDVPEMTSRSEIIVMRAMGNGWYFYKKN